MFNVMKEEAVRRGGLLCQAAGHCAKAAALTASAVNPLPAGLAGRLSRAAKAAVRELATPSSPAGEDGVVFHHPSGMVKVITSA